MGKDALVTVRPSLEWLPMIVALGIFFLGLVVVVTKGRMYLSNVMITYLWFIALSAVISAMRNETEYTLVVESIGVGVLVFFPLFWIVIFNASPTLSLEWFLDLNAYLSLLVSVLGIYQFFLDQTLFGIVTTVYSVESHVTKRAVSIFGTPQTLGIYLALNVAYLITRRKDALTYTILFVDLLVMFLTGTQSVFVFFLIFLIVYVKGQDVRPWRIIVVAVAMLGVLCIGYSKSIQVQRMVGPMGILLGGRIHPVKVLIWGRYLEGAKGPMEFLLGHGVGTAERILYNRYQYGLDSAESYLLKLYYELGAIGVTWFASVYLVAIRNARRYNNKLVPILCGFLTNLAVVHAFAGTFISFYFSAVLVQCLTRYTGMRTSTNVSLSTD